MTNHSLSYILVSSDFEMSDFVINREFSWRGNVWPCVSERTQQLGEVSDYDHGLDP